MHTYIVIYFYKLTVMIGKSKIWWGGYQAGDSFNKELQFEFKGSLLKNREFMLQIKNVCWKNSLLLSGSRPFFLFLLSIYWMSPTHISEDNLLLKVHQFICKSHSKHTHRNTQNNVRPHNRASWPNQSMWHIKSTITNI